MSLALSATSRIGKLESIAVEKNSHIVGIGLLMGFIDGKKKK